jgi:hypothetical protein
VTWRRRRSGPARRLVVLVVSLFVVTLGLGGCAGVVGGLLTTQSDIRSDGYSSVKLSFVDSETNLTVSATSSSTATTADVKAVAQIVWRSFHLRFGDLTVKVHSGSAERQQTFTFTELQQIFGPRDPAYNKTSVRESFEHFGLVVLIIIVVVVVLVVLLILWIVHRRRKKNRMAAQPPPWGQTQGPGPPPPWGQTADHRGPYPYGPYAQPSPQGQGQGQGVPPRGQSGPAPAADPWGRPVAPSPSGWDQPGSGWGQPGEAQPDPGAPPPSSGWVEDTGPSR